MLISPGGTKFVDSWKEHLATFLGENTGKATTITAISRIDISYGVANGNFGLRKEDTACKIDTALIALEGCVKEFKTHGIGKIKNRGIRAMVGLMWMVS